MAEVQEYRSLKSPSISAPADILVCDKRSLGFADVSLARRESIPLGRFFVSFAVSLNGQSFPSTSVEGMIVSLIQAHVDQFES